MTESKVCEFHSGVEKQIETLEANDEKQWTAIERLQNRLPVWGTLVISLLTFFLGLAVGFISVK
jgi:hypothetical protein